MHFYKITLALITISTMHIHGMENIRQWGLPKAPTKVITQSIASAQPTMPQNVVPIAPLNPKLPHTEIVSDLITTSRFDTIKKWMLPIGITCAGSIAFYCLYRKLKETEQQLGHQNDVLDRTNTRYNALQRERNTFLRQLNESRQTSRDRDNRLNASIRERERTESRLTLTQRKLQSVRTQLTQQQQQLTTNRRNMQVLQNEFTQTQAIIASFFEQSIASDAPFLKAMFESHPRLQLHIESSTGISMMHRAVVQNDLSQLEKLIELGLNINIENIKDHTPLVMAALTENIPAMQLLLTLGAEVDHPTNTGLTPLHISIERNNLAAVTLLLASGADINARSEQCKTPLSLALDASPEVLSLILEKEPNFMQTFAFLHSAKDPRLPMLINLWFQNQIALKATCPICLESIKQLVDQGTTFSMPNCCIGIFCKSCLSETRKLQSKSCPLCRQQYKTITAQSPGNTSHAASSSSAGQ